MCDLPRLEAPDTTISLDWKTAQRQSFGFARNEFHKDWFPMDNSSIAGKLVQKVISRILSSDELKLPSESGDFKELRNVVKSSQQSVPEVVKAIFTRFEKWDALTRHAALLLADYFFHRSHQFRLELLDNLPELLELVCESNPLRMPLPPPAPAAKELKIAAIKSIRGWHEKFHDGYKSLDFVDQFLQNAKSVDYERATAAVQAERIATEKRLEKVAEQNTKKVERIMEKFSGAKLDIERNLTEVETGLRILVPTFEDEPTIESEPAENSQDIRDRLNGISDGVTVILKTSGPEVVVTEDNEALVEAVKDGHTMLSGYSKLLVHSLSTLQKSGASQQQIVEVVKLKEKLTGTLKKIEELQLSRRRSNIQKAESESDESEFEDVPEKELEDFVAPYEVPKYIMDKIQRDEQPELPCCSKSLTVEEGKGEESGKRSEIPILPYGLDLKYWGEERGAVQAPRNNFDGHFWRPHNGEDEPRKVEASVYEIRMYPFIGDELRPQRQCRARLANGSLCPRRDKTKCPIHGPIVDRDEEGFPTEEMVATQSTSSEREQEAEDEYIRDVEMATGKDLSAHKSRRKRYAPHEGKIVRDRLEKKLLDKRTLKRVGDTLDAIQRTRIEKKHGSQFVHAIRR